MSKSATALLVVKPERKESLFFHDKATREEYRGIIEGGWHLEDIAEGEYDLVEQAEIDMEPYMEEFGIFGCDLYTTAYTLEDGRWLYFLTGGDPGSTYGYMLVLLPERDDETVGAFNAFHFTEHYCYNVNEGTYEEIIGLMEEFRANRVQLLTVETLNYLRGFIDPYATRFFNSTSKEIFEGLERIDKTLALYDEN